MTTEIQLGSLHLGTKTGLMLLRPLLTGRACPDCGHWSTFHDQRHGEAGLAEFDSVADTRWYYQQMRDALGPRLPGALLAEIDRNLAILGA